MQLSIFHKLDKLRLLETSFLLNFRSNIKFCKIFNQVNYVLKFNETKCKFIGVQKPMVVVSKNSDKDWPYLKITINLGYKNSSNLDLRSTVTGRGGSRRRVHKKGRTLQYLYNNGRAQVLLMLCSKT